MRTEELAERLCEYYDSEGIARVLLYDLGVGPSRMSFGNLMNLWLANLPSLREDLVLARMREDYPLAPEPVTHNRDEERRLRERICEKLGCDVDSLIVLARRFGIRPYRLVLGGTFEEAARGLVNEAAKLGVVEVLRRNLDE